MDELYPIDTVLIVRALTLNGDDPKEKTFKLPYITHLHEKDLLDDGSKPFVMRVCFGTSDSKSPDAKSTLEQLKQFLKQDTLHTLQVFSGDRVLRMRNVTVRQKTMFDNWYVEFETFMSDAKSARINGYNDLKMRETWN